MSAKILLSDCQMNYDKLKRYLLPNMRVLILPYSNYRYFLNNDEGFEELWDFNNGREFNDIAKQLNKFGIEKGNISVINPLKDNLEFILDKMDRVNIIYLTGGNPKDFMYFTPYEVMDKLYYSNKVLMGTSAGSMVLCKEFFMYKGAEEDQLKDEICYGLGLINNMIIVHYNGEQKQTKAIESLRFKFGYSGFVDCIEDGDCVVIDDMDKKEEKTNMEYLVDLMYQTIENNIICNPYLGFDGMFRSRIDNDIKKDYKFSDMYSYQPPKKIGLINKIKSFFIK